jgi:hypothetical protein
MAQADSVRIANPTPITDATSKASTNRRLVDCAFDEPKAGKMAMGSHVVVLGYATAVLLLGWYPWNALLILLLILCRSSRSGGFV